MMRKTLVTGGIAVAVLALGAVTTGTAMAAEAASQKAVITTSTHAFSAPTVYSAPVAWLEKDTTVEARCFVETQRYPGGSDSIYWFKIRDGAGTSFVHSDAIKTSPDIRPCPIV